MVKTGNKKEYQFLDQMPKFYSSPDIEKRVLFYRFVPVLIGITYTVFCWFVVEYDFKYIPPCPFYTLTHIHCPFCGMTQSFGQLLHGNVYQAITIHPFAIPLMVLWAMFIIYSMLTFIRDINRMKRNLHLKSKNDFIPTTLI